MLQLSSSPISECHPANWREFELVHPEFTSADVGFLTWGAAYVLSGLIISDPSLVQGAQVVEIGAGTGLCSLVAASLGAPQVFITDFSEGCLAAARQNVSAAERNGSGWGDINVNNGVANVTVSRFDWTETENLAQRFPRNNNNNSVDVGTTTTTNSNKRVVLGAAVVYEPQHCALVRQVLTKLLDHEGDVAIIAIHEGHLGFHSFVDDMSKSSSDLHLTACLPPIRFEPFGDDDVMPNGCSSDVHVFFIARKHAA